MLQNEIKIQRFFPLFGFTLVFSCCSKMLSCPWAEKEQWIQKTVQSHRGSPGEQHSKWGREAGTHLKPLIIQVKLSPLYGFPVWLRARGWTLGMQQNSLLQNPCRLCKCLHFHHYVFMYPLIHKVFILQLRSIFTPAELFPALVLTQNEASLFLT